jgi:hypothetical protein
MIHAYHSRLPTGHRRCGLLREASLTMVNKATRGRRPYSFLASSILFLPKVLDETSILTNPFTVKFERLR